MKIENDVANNQFVAQVLGGEAKLIYKRGPAGVMDIVSTRVPPEARGQGVADQLVEAAVKMAKEQNLRIVPTCSYVKTWFDKHPEQQHALQ